MYLGSKGSTLVIQGLVYPPLAALLPWSIQFVRQGILLHLPYGKETEIEKDLVTFSVTKNTSHVSGYSPRLWRIPCIKILEKYYFLPFFKNIMKKGF